VRLSPAEPHCGIRFRRTDVTDRDADIRASVEAVCQTRLGTVIGNADGVSVSTVEHLMAAFCGLGIDNVIVEIDGPEVPIMDGSCEPLVAAIDKAGRRTQAARRRFIEVLEPIIVTDGDKSASLSPSAGFQLAFDIAFETSAIGRQHLEISVDEQTFRRDLAAARTFGFLHEVEALRAAGLARGGSLETVVVIDGDQILNPGGLRHFDEFVRHKALDAMGDLYLLGAPLIGRYDGVYSGHALNNRLAHALIARPEAWRFAMPRQSFAQAV
jgi:UDP-3-O-[3-hydroxymyristoyl] N-acetylglucosamine deacetylase